MFPLDAQALCLSMIPGEGALPVNTLFSKYSHKISGPVLVAGYKLSTLFSGTTRWSLGLLRAQ